MCPTQLGPDQGPLEIDVEIDLARARLSIDQPEVLEVDEKIGASPVDITVEDGKVRFHDTIEKFSEFVIGPVGATKQAFFS